MAGWAESAATVVFMGTGPFALPTLRRMVDAESTSGVAIKVAAVVTQPDRAAGRGRQVGRGEVAQLADEAGIRVLQPATFKLDDAVHDLGSLEPDLLVVASYGLILPGRVLDLPRRGSLNLHPSLLPRHRGPSPVAGAILAGDEETGVTVMEMTAQMDAGPIVAQKSCPVCPTDTTESLTSRLAEASAELMLASLPGWLEASTKAIPQDDARATYTSRLTKDMGRINWTEPAEQIERKVRAYVPWPVAHTNLGDGEIRVWSSEVSESASTGAVAGTVLEAGQMGILMQTGGGTLMLKEVQPAGGKRMPAAAFATGRRNLMGTVAG